MVSELQDGWVVAGPSMVPELACMVKCCRNAAKYVGKVNMYQWWLTLHGLAVLTPYLAARYSIISGLLIMDTIS